MFEIEVNYTTGDSFLSHDTSDTIGHVWDDMNVVKENLERIINWTRYYNYQTKYWGDKPIPEKPDYYIQDDSNLKLPSMKLLSDDRTEFNIVPFWSGPFDTFNFASVVLAQYTVTL